jgi:hypothetical protein
LQLKTIDSYYATSESAMVEFEAYAGWWEIWELAVVADSAT